MIMIALRIPVGFVDNQSLTVTIYHLKMKDGKGNGNQQILWMREKQVR